MYSSDPELHLELRDSRLWIVRSMKRPLCYVFCLSALWFAAGAGRDRELLSSEMTLPLNLRILCLPRHQPFNPLCSLARPDVSEGHLNIVNVTVELSSFGRPKKEKLEPHLRPLREATAPT
ncbi:hypothetical protein Taro_013592 [Colocasia esculenta]|uniref:Uncharacterized protein n=1 Tax=Colocasia esculenta TaxID=4460 RepID=A0A843UJ73_COLES|nr:hypothetical protein [Colocasia esculenta]